MDKQATYEMHGYLIGGQCTLQLADEAVFIHSDRVDITIPYSKINWVAFIERHEQVRKRKFATPRVIAGSYTGAVVGGTIGAIAGGFIGNAIAAVPKFSDKMFFDINISHSDDKGEDDTLMLNAKNLRYKDIVNIGSAFKQHAPQVSIIHG